MESQVALSAPQLVVSAVLEISGKHFCEGVMAVGAIDGWMKCFHPGSLAPTEEGAEDQNPA